MARLCLAQRDCETASAKAEALRNAAGHHHLGAVAGDSIVLAVDPHGPAAVVDLKHAPAESAIRSGDASRDGYILVGVFTGVLFNVGDFRGWPTAGQH